MEIKNKTVLITGAALGIGRCTAEEFAKAGAKLILTDVNEKELLKTVENLKQYNSNISTFIVDISNKKQVQSMAKDVLKEFGFLDILINNAGVGHHGELKDTSLETWDKLLKINLWGTLYHNDAFLPSMLAKKQGHIVNVASGQAFFKLPTWGAYAIIKLAAGAYSELLHYELKTHNVNVTTVYPFMVNTGFYDDVDTETILSELSMKLLPYYSLTPEQVGKIIFKAVKNKKAVEMVHPFNYIGKYLNFENPSSEIFNRITSYFMVKKDSDESNIITDFFAKLNIPLPDIETNKIGFQMDELMAGEHEFEDGFGPKDKKGKRPMFFNVTWGPKNLLKWSNPLDKNFMINDLKGTVTVDGLCNEAECEGTLELKYIAEQKIRYLFEFKVDNKTYSFKGEKRNIYPWNLHVSHTTCYGELIEKDSGKLVSKSITHFHLDTIPDFIKSFKMTA